MERNNIKLLSEVEGIVILIIIFIVIMVGISNCNKNRNYAVLQTKYNIATDSLKTTRNSKGQLESQINILSTDKVKDFEDIQTKNVNIQLLQAKCLYYQSIIKSSGSITNASTITKIDTFIRHDTAVHYDLSNYRDNDIYEYSLDSSFHGWITGKVIVSKDSLHLVESIKNNFSIVIGEKNKVPIALITNDNPYTKTKSLECYQVTVPKKHTIKYILEGTGIGVVLTSLLFILK